MKITRIVLTGGPCAGKSTGLAVVEQKLKNLGYRVIIMDEMATNVLKSGVHPMEIGVAFQDMLIQLQVRRDEIYKDTIEKVYNQEEKIVIIFDRGMLDGQAYCTIEELDNVLDKLKLQRNKILTSYDGVFHLVTAADGAESFYTTENNTVRMETAEEAKVKDKITLDCWVGHPHLRVINNKGRNFDQKMTKLLGEIMGLLGEPVPLEIERKFLIKIPNISELAKLVNINKSEIVQTYLTTTDKKVERRVRQRGTTGDYSYYYTEKQHISSGTREEKERKISEREYLNFLMEADTTKHQVRKDRYCFIYKDRYFELDIYPFWDSKAILEIEVDNLNEKVELPDFIDIIKEVTDDKQYKNSSLAVNNIVD